MTDLVAQQRFKYKNDHHLFSFILIALFASLN